jgi:hypothetical protein
MRELNDVTYKDRYGATITPALAAHEVRAESRTGIRREDHEDMDTARL